MSAGLRSYLLLLRWNLLRNRRILVLITTVQVALGIGIIYGFGFLVPQVTPTVALFLATGAPTLGMILTGLTVVTQEVAQARISGRFGYVAALPVPRLAPMLAEVTYWVLVQLPGWIATLLVAVVHFSISLHVGVLIVPAVVLVSLTAASIGYAIAVTTPAQAATQLSSFLSIALLLFSPINFPIDRLPGWLQDVHRILPITYMADAIRGGLTGRFTDSAPLVFGVVAAWCAGGLGLSVRAARRRG